jgi:hypothetical protein
MFYHYIMNTFFFSFFKVGGKPGQVFAILKPCLSDHTHTIYTKSYVSSIQIIWQLISCLLGFDE